MKKLYTLANRSLRVVWICLTLLFSSNLTAQDLNEGWYADGYPVETISCYSFKKLQVVILYNPEWASYEYLSISIIGFKAKIIPLQSVNSYLKGKYLVCTVVSTEESVPLTEDRSRFNEIGTATVWIDRGKMKYDVVLWKHSKEEKPADDANLSATIYGLNQTNIKEEYDQGCQCIKKTKNYSFTKLSKEYKLICTNRLKGCSKDTDPENLDITTPCTYSGTKVDFNNLGGKSGSSSSNTKTEEKTTVTKITGSNSSSASAKTIITTLVVKTQAQLKPLDKTKSGYFEDKEDGKIIRAGYKKGEDYNGEVREYNSNGTVNDVTVYSNGVQNGISLKYDDDGKLSLSSNYKNGNPDGTWQWYSSGVLSKTAKYVNGEEQD